MTGYQDDPAAPGGGYYIVENQWGTAWGSPNQAPGYGEVAYATLGTDGAHEIFAFTSPAYVTGTLGTYTWAASGGGSWSTAASNWSGGGTASAWANGENQAVFSGSGGAISLDQGISAMGCPSPPEPWAMRFLAAHSFSPAAASRPTSRLSSTRR